MTDFQEIMNREPKFKLTNKSRGVSFMLGCRFYEFTYEGIDYHITDYDITSEFGANLFLEKSMAIVFGENISNGVKLSTYGHVSRDLLLALVEQEPHNVEMFHNFMTVLKNRLTK